MSNQPDLDTEWEKFRQRLPHWMAAGLHGLMQSSPWLRWPAAFVLIVAGIFGFLPILGFWMVPLGLLLIVKDIPPLHAPLARLFDYINRKWPA